jgi:hypothetical protein
MPIDTLKISKHLQEGDTFTPEQSERLAEALSDLDVASATRDDLDSLEKRLTQRIEVSEDRLAKRIAESESSLYRALLIGLGAVTGVLGTLILVSNYLMG